MDNDLTYTIILTSFLMPLLLSGILVYFVIRYQRNKRDYEIERKEAEIKEKNLIIEKQQALEQERTRIAAELHDDLGGGLTSIQFLGQKLLKQLDDEEEKASLNKIVGNSKSLIENTSEIIWAMNVGFDSIESLAGYCRRYASEYLSQFDLKLDFQTDMTDPGHFLSGEKRRNLFLVFKEALHNIVKHAEAQKVDIRLKSSTNALEMSIHDDGNGLGNEYSAFGNGLENMRKRIQTLNGSIKFLNESGLKVHISVPM